MTPTRKSFPFAEALLLSFVFLASASALTPGEVSTLSWCPGSRECLQWSTSSNATSYVLYRGDASSLPSLADLTADSCQIRNFTGTTSGPILRQLPLPSDGLQWFLVAGHNVTDGDGPVGNGSSGPEILNSTGPCCGQTVFYDTFTGADGSPWPLPWTDIGSDALKDLQSNRGRQRPVVAANPYTLGRMYAPLDPIDPQNPAGFGEENVEATFTIEFGDIARQGIGFYVRQNGHRMQTDPTHGQGYAVFIEGYTSPQHIGLWKEQDGVESQLTFQVPPLTIQNGVRYRVRFRCVQWTATATQLYSKMWVEGSAEPAGWAVSLSPPDSTPVLQNSGGGIAVDSYSTITNPVITPADTFLDDVEVTRICNPLLGTGALTPVSEAFTFTEGPVWRGSELFFTDVNTNTIYRHTPPSTIAVFRAGSNGANGLATDRNGDLLTAEQATRRLTRTSGSGAISTVVDHYLSYQFNSPNDIAVRADGTKYFSDPTYGNNPRLIPFNGLFRLDPSGSLTAEWQGDPVNDQPNGVTLSPDENTLYVSDSQPGTVLAWNINADGSLGSSRTLATGLTIPDGMCMDSAGNLYVPTWSTPSPSRLFVYDPNGTPWGFINIPRQATNCAFGGSDRRTLFVTAHEGLYRLTTVVPGMPGP